MSEPEKRYIGVLYDKTHQMMDSTCATFDEDNLDKVIKYTETYTMPAPQPAPEPAPEPFPTLAAQAGDTVSAGQALAPEELPTLLAYTARSSDIRKKKFNPKHIKVHKLGRIGSFVNTTLENLSQQPYSSSDRVLLDFATNEIKNFIEKQSPSYKFNTISWGNQRQLQLGLDQTTFVASFRTLEYFGRCFIATAYHIDPLSEKVILLEKKYNALVEKNEEYEKKFDKIKDILFPSTVIISIKENRFDLIGAALIKAKNLEVLEVFITLEKRFASVDNEFNIKPEKYTVFAITQDASKELIERFIVDSDGNPISNSDTSALKKIMEYHIVRGELKIEDIKQQLIFTSILTSYNGLSLVVRLDGDDLYINESKIVEKDLVATNGIVHIIDKLLVPEE